MFGISFMKLSIITLIIVVLLFSMAGCGAEERSDNQLFPTTHIKGLVSLNKAISKYPILVTFTPVVPNKKDKIVSLEATTDCKETGVFEIDLGAGEYKVTFQLPARIKGKSIREPGEDLLEDKYSDPDESNFKISVKQSIAEETIDIGQYELEGDIVIDQEIHLIRTFEEQKKYIEALNQ